MGFIKSIINLIPSKKIRNIIHPVYYFFLNSFISTRSYYENIIIKKTIIKQRKALELIKHKQGPVQVVFIVINSSIWKYDYLYHLFDKDPNFEPHIAVCPRKDFKKELTMSELRNTFNFFDQKGLNVFSTYDNNKKRWKYINEIVEPDVVFFTNPHNVTKKQYCIRFFKDKLNCYAPYSTMCSDHPELQYDQLFHNVLWKAFYETSIHKDMAVKSARNKGANVVVSGSLMYDFFVGNTSHNDVWKIKNKKIKRIIYAPHHSFHDMEKMMFSTFLENGEYILDISIRLKDKIQIAFKPHPLLKDKLYKYPLWGKEKTNQYYNTWKNLENGQLEENNYIELFLSSDAMILDSISFMTEYCLTGKPSLFMMKHKDIDKKLFNNYGKEILSNLYKSFTAEDISSFIEDVVINENDTMKAQRKDFINKYLIPPNNNKSAENIYEHIKKELL